MLCANNNKKLKVTSGGYLSKERNTSKKQCMKKFQVQLVTIPGIGFQSTHFRLFLSTDSNSSSINTHKKVN